MEKFRINVDKFLSERNKFLGMLKNILGYDVDEESIKSSFDIGGAFELCYGRWDTKDQFSITYMPFSGTDIKLRIDTNPKTYKRIVMQH